MKGNCKIESFVEAVPESLKSAFDQSQGWASNKLFKCFAINVERFLVSDSVFHRFLTTEECFRWCLQKYNLFFSLLHFGSKLLNL